MSIKTRYITLLNRHERSLNGGQRLSLQRRFRQGGYTAALGLLTCQLVANGVKDRDLEFAIVLIEANL